MTQIDVYDFVKHRNSGNRIYQVGLKHIPSGYVIIHEITGYGVVGKAEESNIRFLRFVRKPTKAEIEICNICS